LGPLKGIAAGSTSDDTQSLNRHFARGGVIRLAPKTYHISGDLTILVDGTSLSGSGGAIIQKIAPCQIWINASSCLVEGLTIDGNNQGGSGVFVTGSFNSFINCRSQNNGGHGFAFDPNNGTGPNRRLAPGDDLTTNTCKFNEVRSCTAIGNHGV